MISARISSIFSRCWIFVSRRIGTQSVPRECGESSESMSSTATPRHAPLAPVNRTFLLYYRILRDNSPRNSRVLHCFSNKYFSPVKLCSLRAQVLLILQIEAYHHRYFCQNERRREVWFKMEIIELQSGFFREASSFQIIRTNNNFLSSYRCKEKWFKIEVCKVLYTCKDVDSYLVYLPANSSF